MSTATKKRNLTCCCCGDDAGCWEQHWNRDTGYGMCVSCIAMVRERGHDDIENLYGVEGVNWGKESAAEFDATWEQSRR